MLNGVVLIYGCFNLADLMAMVCLNTMQTAWAKRTMFNIYVEFVKS